MARFSRRHLGALVAVLAAWLLAGASRAASTDVPPPGANPKIDSIKLRDALPVAAIGEFPWLPETTTGSGRQFSGPARVLAEA